MSKIEVIFFQDGLSIPEGIRAEVRGKMGMYSNAYREPGQRDR